MSQATPTKIYRETSKSVIKFFKHFFLLLLILRLNVCHLIILLSTINAIYPYLLSQNLSQLLIFCSTLLNEFISHSFGNNIFLRCARKCTLPYGERLRTGKVFFCSISEKR